MQKINLITTFTLLFALTLASQAKAQRKLSLEEAIELAHRQSVEANVALNRLKTAYWQYRTYKADRLPEINFSASLPDFRRSNSLYQNQDGSYTFVRNNIMRLAGDVSIDQNISWTGGKLSLSTSLEYLDPMKTAYAKKRYMSVPIGLSYSQPIFGVNRLKWESRIEPIRYKEAKANYVENIQQSSLHTIRLYFQLLLAKEKLQIAQQNKKNADRIYEIALARRKMGQISENELLQLEHADLKAASALTSEESALKSAMFSLRSYLGLDEATDLDPQIPEAISYPIISYEIALEKAQNNNPFAMNIRRRQLQADYAVAEAKGQRREVELFASLGYTGQNEAFPMVYQNLQDYQVVKVGVKIPLLDWGKREGRVKVAESNREVVASQIRQEEMDFKQNLFLLVERYNNQAEQLRIAEKADTIAQRRYQTSVEAFMIGKINTLDLSDAQVSKDEARAQYIADLHRYWYYLYQLKSVTLYDFERGKSLDAEFDQLVQ